MKFIFALVALAVCLASVSTQDFPVDTTSSNNSDQNFAAQLSTIIVEGITRGFGFLFDLFEIKVRSVRFLSTLYTTDNLILLKKIMHLGLRFGNWLYSIVPNSTTEGKSRLLSLLIPQNRDTYEDIPQPNDFQFKPEDLPSQASTDNRRFFSDSTNTVAQKDVSENNDNYGNVKNLERLIRGY